MSVAARIGAQGSIVDAAGLGCRGGIVVCYRRRVLGDVDGRCGSVTVGGAVIDCHVDNARRGDPGCCRCWQTPPVAAPPGSSPALAGPVSVTWSRRAPRLSLKLDNAGRQRAGYRQHVVKLGVGQCHLGRGQRGVVGIADAGVAGWRSERRPGRDVAGRVIDARCWRSSRSTTGGLLTAATWMVAIAVLLLLVPSLTTTAMLRSECRGLSLLLENSI